MKNFILSKKGTVLLVISGVLTAAICLIMNLILIPAIESAAGGLTVFDMSFLYSADDARAFLQAISEDGKNTYLYRQLPLDFFYPVCYGCFFVFALAKLQKKLGAFSLAPLFLMAFDYAENISVVIMLKKAEFSSSLALLGSAFTTVKTVLMYAVFVLIIVLAVRAVVRKKKGNVK